MVGLDCLSQSVGEAPVQRGEKGSMPKESLASEHPPGPSRVSSKTGGDEAVLAIFRGGAQEGPRTGLLLLRWPAAA